MAQEQEQRKRNRPPRSEASGTQGAPHSGPPRGDRPRGDRSGWRPARGAIGPVVIAVR